jgi:hypothetical protein
MTYKLEDLIADCRTAIDPSANSRHLEQVCRAAEKAAAEPDFVAAYFGPDAEVGTHTLYQDPDMDFMILAHIKDSGFKSQPHDHGASWAVYCQITEYVDMNEYLRKDDGATTGIAKLELSRSYSLKPGQAGYFDAFQIHSIMVPDKARFMRITGTDLSRLETSHFDLTKGTVTSVAPNQNGKVSGDAPA